MSTKKVAKKHPIATAFKHKDGVIRSKSRFILGFSAVANMGGREFGIVAPSLDELEVAWLDAVKYPLDKSRVQKVAIILQSNVELAHPNEPQIRLRNR